MSRYGHFFFFFSKIKLTLTLHIGKAMRSKLVVLMEFNWTFFGCGHKGIRLFLEISESEQILISSIYDVFRAVAFVKHHKVFLGSSSLSFMS